MPLDATFFPLFPPRRHPGADRARERHLDWAIGHGLIQGAAARSRHRSRSLTDLAAYACPDVSGVDLDLVTDAVSLGFPLDAQFAGPLGHLPDRAARLCTELAAIPYRAPGRRPPLDLPITRAYADVWARTAAGMSPSWRERAAGNLTRFFRSFLQEAQNTALGIRLDEDAYLALRRHAVGSAPWFDLIERAGHFEVPPRAYWSPEVRTLTRCAGDVVLLCDDLRAAERNQARPGGHNLVLIRQRALGLGSTAEAMAHVSAMIITQLELFDAVSGRVPGRYAGWGLDARGMALVERYLAGLRSWMAAAHTWATADPGLARDRVHPHGDPHGHRLATEGIAEPA